MDMKRFFLYFIVIAALALAGCGGNGGTTAMNGDGNGDGNGMPMQCPDGQTGEYPNCMTPPPPPPDCTLGGGEVACGTAAGAIADPNGDMVPGGVIADYARPTGSELPAMQFAAGGAITIDGNADSAFDNAADDRLNRDEEGIMNTAEFGAQDYARPSRGGFAGSVHKRTMDDGDTVDMLTIYTDAKANGPDEYNDYYASADVGDRDGITGIDDSGDLNVLTFDADVSDISMRFMGSMIPSGAGASTMITATDDTDTEDVDERTFMGMFHGVPGTYTCTTAGAGSSGCTLINNDDGDLVQIVGTLTFTPEEQETGDDPYMVAGVIPDADYLAFGYWVQATEGDDGTEYDVAVFSNGSQAFSGTISTLTGTAEYSGGAAGLYVLKTGDVASAVPSASGHFTAEANLTARFGGDAIAVNDQFEVEGAITNFQDADGNTINSAWSVDLNKIENLNTGTAPFTGTTTGGGSWTATFYGNPATTTPATPAAEQYPTGVAGEFNAHFANGHVVGGYGATR